LREELPFRGVYLTVDIIVNAMAYVMNGSNPGTTVDYSVFNPFDDQKYFFTLLVTLRIITSILSYKGVLDGIRCCCTS
jgi:hypothetical protein